MATPIEILKASFKSLFESSPSTRETAANGMGDAIANYVSGGGGGSTPTGTGFRHVTSGVEDSASKLVQNVDVKSDAAIAESKLALDYSTASLNSGKANDSAVMHKAGNETATGIKQLDDLLRAYGGVDVSGDVKIFNAGKSNYFRFTRGGVISDDLCIVAPNSIAAICLRSNGKHHLFIGNNKLVGTDGNGDIADATSALTTILPSTKAAESHKFLTAYDASTHAFANGQPDYSDISSTPTLGTLAALAIPSGTGWAHVTAGAWDAASSIPSKSDVGLGNVTNDSQVKRSEMGANSGVATLDISGKLPTTQLPDLAIVQYLGSVASQVAMLALTGQLGDWCIRSDLGSTFVITGADPTLLASWTQLAYPAAPITSVNGQTGPTVTLGASDVGAPALTLLTTLGDTPVRDGSGWARLAGNTTSIKKFMRSTGAAGVATAQAWDTVLWADVDKTNSSLADLATRGIANLSDSTTVGQNLVKLATPAAISFPRFNTDGTVTLQDLATYYSQINVGVSGGIATLNVNGKVIEAPAAATATPTGGKIPIADGSGTLNAWITGFMTNPMLGVGDIIRGGAAGAPTNLAAPTINGNYLLTSLVTAGAAVAPSWVATSTTGGANTIPQADANGKHTLSSLSLVGVTAVITGPHFRVTTSDSAYPSFMQLNYSVGNTQQFFGAYYDFVSVKASHTSAVRVQAIGGSYNIATASGLTPGSAATFVNRLVVTDTGAAVTGGLSVSGLTASTPLVTTATKELASGAWGTTAGTFCEGNDARPARVANALTASRPLASDASGVVTSLSGVLQTNLASDVTMTSYNLWYNGPYIDITAGTWRISATALCKRGTSPNYRHFFELYNYTDSSPLCLALSTTASNGYAGSSMSRDITVTDTKRIYIRARSPDADSSLLVATIDDGTTSAVASTWISAEQLY
jgi:hypothetical protein